MADKLLIDLPIWGEERALLVGISLCHALGPGVKPLEATGEDQVLGKPHRW